uniref:Metallo-beta-lactamase domain-containing protein n=1 Tax=Musa acuminata subsp. malaccensis TaxID=214687 RepID=A0A804KED9_MUSAM
MALPGLTLRSLFASFQHHPTTAAATNGASLSPSPSLPSPSHLQPSIRFKPKSNFCSAGRLRSSSSAVPAALAQSTKPIKLTYLEGNSWLWELGGVNILVDPILVGNLDFGQPWLFDGAKKILKNFKSLDDHCHVKTLTPLSKMLPGLPVISTPNAEAILSKLFKNVTYLEPGQSIDVEVKDRGMVNVCATAGPILGPPWQRPENGYIVESGQSHLTVYYEPHCVYNHSFLQNYQADIVITPVIKQMLPAFTLVSGQEDAVQLAKLLKAKYIVPMKNGDLDTKGIITSILYDVGTTESFKELLSRELPNVRVLEPTPGIPLEIPVASVVS